MKKRVFLIVAAICVIGLVALIAGCGSKSGSTGGDKTIKVACVGPLSGSNAAYGDSMRMGAELAFEQNKANLEKSGFKVEFVSGDDQADPKMGVSVAQRFANDPDILVVIAHINSGVMIPALDAYDKANLAAYTPICTNTKITELGYKNVGRISNRDDFQGFAGANFAFDNLKAKSYFVVQDQTAYGQGIADNFKKKADELGMNSLGYEGLTVGEVDFSGIVNKIISTKPDVVYFGGLYTEGGLLLKQLREKGSEAEFISCDGADSAEYVKIAGNAVIGSYYTNMAADLKNSPLATDFFNQYQQKYNKTAEAYSVYGYDTGLAVMKGLEIAIQDAGDKKPTRQQVVDAMRKVQVQAITSMISFDDKGDNEGAMSYVLRFDKAEYPGTVIAVNKKN